MGKYSIQNYTRLMVTMILKLYFYAQLNMSQLCPEAVALLDKEISREDIIQAIKESQMIKPLGLTPSLQNSTSVSTRNYPCSWTGSRWKPHPTGQC